MSWRVALGRVYSSRLATLRFVSIRGLSSSSSASSAASPIDLWKRDTQELIEENFEWNPSHQRKAEQCLQFWSQNEHIGFVPPEDLKQLWDRMRQEQERAVDETTTRTASAIAQQAMSRAQFDYAILSFAKHGMPLQALELLKQFAETEFGYTHPNNRHSPSSYHLNAILHAFAQAHEPERAHETLMECFESSNPSVAALCTDYNLTSVLDAWSRIGNAERAMELLKWAEQNASFELGTAPYNATLAAIARSQSPDSVDKAQSLIRRMPVRPNGKTWSTLLVAASTSGSPEQAQEILFRLLQQGQQVNTTCLNVVLNAWGSQRQADKAADLLFNWIGMLEQQDGFISQEETTQQQDQELSGQNANTTADRLVPNVASFNTVLATLAKSHNSGQRAQELLETMKSFGIEPDGISLNSVLSAWANQGDTDRADAMLEQLLIIEKDNTQRRMAFNTTIHAWATRVANANDKVQHRYRPDAMDVYDHTQEIVGRMRQQGISPDLVTYNSLLKVLAAVGAASEAAQLLERMPVEPDTVSFSTVIDAWAKSGDRRGPDMAYRMLQQMEMRGVAPNVISFNTVISAFSRAKYPQASLRAQGIFDAMRSSNMGRTGSSARLPKPNLQTYCSLLLCWVNTTHPQKARHASSVLSQMMEDFGDYNTTADSGMNNDNWRSSNRRHIDELSTIRNAHNMVIKACAYTPVNAGDAIRAEALEIAVRTFQSTPEPNETTKQNYSKALQHLVSNKRRRDELLRDVAAGPKEG